MKPATVKWSAISTMLQVAIATLLAACATVDGVVEKPEPPSSVHMSRLASLEGAWIAEGDGFTSRPTYEWAMPGVLLRSHNTLRSASGQVIGVYEGDYAWNPDDCKYRFWAAGRDGTLHEGEAQWRQDQLWHLATVRGGRVVGYRSTLEVAGDALHYRAIYSPSASEADVMAAPVLIYRRAR